MNGSRAFYRASAAFFLLTALWCFALHAVAPALPADGLGIALLLVMSGVALTLILFLTNLVYDFFQSR